MNKRPPIIIRPNNRGILDYWNLQAIQEPTIFPFMTFGRFNDGFAIEESDWSRTILMDPDLNAVLLWSNIRESNCANICLWSLPGSKQRRSAGFLMLQLPSLVRRYGVEYLDCAVHESNHQSRYLLDRQWGQPWGRKPSGAWNALTGEYEDSIHYRRLVRLSSDG